MKRFTFDTICFASILIQAEDERVARKIAEKALETMTISDQPAIEGLEGMSLGYNSEDSIDLQYSEELLSNSKSLAELIARLGPEVTTASTPSFSTTCRCSPSVSRM